MKKIFSLALFALSINSFAQVLPPDQCPRPDLLLSREYVGLSSETVGQNFQRQGNHQIPKTSEFAGQLKSRIFKVYEEKFCVAKVYAYQQRTCVDVNPELALGQGNQQFKSIFDLRVTLLKRAELFARTVRYGSSANQPARLNTATEVVKNITRYASSSSIPHSWESFSSMVKKVVEEGFITQAEFDEIVVMNASFNRKQLGFTPLEGVQFNEGKGNGKLSRMFDLNITILHRASLIRTTISGVNEADSHMLAKSFIDFASVNGVPANWNQFVLLMKDAAVKNVIPESEFIQITQTLEQINRKNLGYEISYFICKMETLHHFYNAVDVSRKNEFKEDVSKNFRVQVANAPLLKGEAEEMRVSFHGLNGISINPSESYNKYTVETSEAADATVFKLSGARKKVTPPNSIYAEVHHQGKNVNVSLRNDAFNPSVGGKVEVKVVFYEKLSLWKDKKLGEKTFELKDGSLTAFKPNVQMKKPSRKAYVKVQMKVSGSPYYSNSYSGVKEYKE